MVQLTQRLRDQDPAVMYAYEWLEKRLTKSGTRTEQLVLQEHQRQAAAQVTVGNIITSMRLLSALEWRVFVESVSLIDPVLANDPAEAYSLMDFATRDRYRHSIERIAKRARASEMDVARKALELARAAQQQQQQAADARPRHVGYYLIDEGDQLLEKAFNYRPFPVERARRAVLRHPTLFYLGMVAVITAGLAAVLLYYAFASGASPLVMLLTGLLALIPASDLALSAVNYDVTSTFNPFQLPKMDPAAGVPEDAQTMVVIPTIFSDEATVIELVRRLEVHYLANQDDHIFFGLLGDFGEASSEQMHEDAAITEVALAGIEELNARYAIPGLKRFHLFMRRRRWNASEEKWLGWERKRGKLQDFNRLLRSDDQHSFFVCTADQALLKLIRYVITLDSDTQLPRDCARRLIGAITHPLNRAQFDHALRRVTRGYAILQPRVSVSLESSSRSTFARIFSGHTGIDPYTTAVSDVYQDLFGEGSYTGKGLYDVDAFEAALDGRVPENALLSHDLFESLYARAALVTDIELLDDYPAQYDAFAKRQHRWTRGDWQIARWLMPTVPEESGRAVAPNRLPLVSRWKIFDNLRRSLVAPAVVLWLLAAWTVLPGPAFFTLFAVLVLAFPVYAHVTTSLLFHPRGVPWTSHFWSVWGDVRTNTAQVALTITFLPHQAFLMTDAIWRTFYRKFVSHKHLLEWVTAAQIERSGAAQTPHGFLRFMWSAIAISVIAICAVAIVRPSSFLYALPFALCWLASPLIAHAISRRLEPTLRSPLTTDDAREARLLARHTWSYFEAFTGEDDHWLPPDNFQEDPKPIIAHRTSPTNIGLLLLSTVAARDFGYTGTLETVERTELTFAALAKLQRFNGHFLNWYDTQRLEPLQPEYVSTVDSGNLAGHLIALKQSCIELPDAALFDERVLAGLADAMTLINREFARLGPLKQRTQVVTVKSLRGEIEQCAQLVSGAAPPTLSGWNTLLASLRERLMVIEDMVESLAHEHGGANFEELRAWVSALKRQAFQHRRDLETLTPWALLPRASAEAVELPTNASDEDRADWAALTEAFDRVLTPAEIPEFCAGALRLLERMPGASAPLVRAFAGALAQSKKFLFRLTEIAHACDRYVEEMDFKFLFDKERKVFVIGYNVSERRRDNSFTICSLRNRVSPVLWRLRKAIFRKTIGFIWAAN
ncbi:MAG: hypothetical protein WKF30_05615 [Pyrinomonadaceae bacterium]